jgi:phosphatidylglycerol:prolipoprotein diacylglycerol transferase
VETPLLAAIPYFSLPVYEIRIPGISSTLPIDPWATLVCIGFVVGLEFARYRAIKLGLDIRNIVDGAVVTVLTGFLFAHLFTVFFYFPERLHWGEFWAAYSSGNMEDAKNFAYDGVMSIVRVWEGFASTGGWVGSVVGSVVFFVYVRKVDWWRHADTIAWGFPVGWFFGRLGCGVVHDHIGAVTTFPLAMAFPEGHYAAGLRHELGLYEAAAMLPVIALFMYLGRQDRPPGFWLGLFCVLYAPLRFGLDFLRNVDLTYQDARYFGLTPAHYAMLVMFGLGVWLLVRAHRISDWKPHPMDGSANLDANLGSKTE